MNKLIARSRSPKPGDTLHCIHESPAQQPHWRFVSLFLVLAAGCSSAGEGEAPLPDTETAGGTSEPGASGGNGSQPDSSKGGASSAGGGNAAGGADTDLHGGSGGSGDAGGSGGSGDAGGPSGSGGEGSGGKGSGGKSGSPDEEDEELAGNEYGFSLRVPAADDLDWLCTFGQSEPSGYVYVRLTQTGTEQAGIATVPVYAASLAQISIDGTVSTLDNPAYDYGGGHHNDSLQFDYAGKTYKYYHSSFGFGFRSCQPMDCIDVYELGATTPETEGCAANRTLPEVCVQIQADGTHDPLVDTFQKCPGDAD